MRTGPRRIRPRRPAGAVRLSLCMIVKNEAETLEQCLRLARPHVDEIVVVDTGSTDGTQDIARRYADVYDEIEWPGSFSDARNHSFDLASGDYILVLDGDEYIEGDDAWQAIRNTIAGGGIVCVVLPVRNILPSNQIVAADRMWQERVLRNHPMIRYMGRVHNQIQESVLAYARKTGEQIVQAEAEIMHTGYAHAPERMRQKYEPRVKLLVEEYTNPRSEIYRAYYGFQLGVVYYVLQQYEEALAVLGEIDYAKLNAHNGFYAHLLGAQSALKLNNAAAALVHCDRMLKLSRTEPIAYHTTGLALLLAGKIGDGMLMLLEAASMADAGGMHVRFVVNTHHMLQLLARVCGKANLKDHQKAFAALAAQPSYNPQLVQALLRSLKTGIVMASHAEQAA